MIASIYSNGTHATARSYAARGWHVLPLHGIGEDGVCACGKADCHSPGKHPLISGGLKNATSEAGQIDDWFATWPHANIGIRTGVESGVVVLDIDQKGDPQCDGPASLNQLITEHGPLPDTVQAVTGSGGMHYFFKHPGTNIGNRTAVCPGIDFRGDQGYVVVAPSRHVSGGTYQWVEGHAPEDIEPAEIPGWLLTLIAPPAPATKPSRTQGKTSPPRTTHAAADRTHPELLKAASRYVAKVPNVGEGSRNQAAFNLAGHLAAIEMKDTGEAIDEEDVLDLVRAWNERNSPPLDDAELRQAVKSALVNGTPRKPKLIDPEPDHDDDQDASVATELVRLVEEQADLFHAPGEGGECYATVKTKKGPETFGVDRKAFRSWLLLQYRRKFNRVPGEQALREAVSMVASIAEHDRDPRPVWRRVAEHDGAVWIDLCDDERRAVRIDARGWKVVTDPPVRFLRGCGMEPLPVPDRGGHIGLLRAYVNVGSEDDWALLLAWLISPFLVGGPYPCLIVNGEQGSAKTTLTRTVLSLLDPAMAQLRAAPSGERDLMIRATNTFVLAYDNISTIQPWLSNALCRLATGGGFGTRKLYANDDEMILDIKQPVILNGIEEFVTASDLLDRSVLLQLQTIPATARRDEKSLNTEFQRDRPLILGALFDAVSTALRRLDQVVLAELPRMADFARWATAAEPGLGLADGAVIGALTRRRDDADLISLENNVIGPYLLKLLKAKPAWSGTTTGLLEVLNRQGYGLTAGHDDPTRRSKYWPQTARGLAAHLDRLKPVLRRMGYSFERSLSNDRDRTRLLSFGPTCTPVAAPGAATPTSNA